MELYCHRGWMLTNNLKVSHFKCFISLAGEETAVLKRSRYKKAFLAPPYHYSLPNAFLPALRPIVIGTGPAGLFAGLILAQAGARPILIERGRDVERRSRDVEEFFLTGKLNPCLLYTSFIFLCKLIEIKTVPLYNESQSHFIWI